MKRPNNIRPQGRKHPGLIVETASGKLGRTFNGDQPVNGKVLVYLLDKDMHEVLDHKGQWAKLLCRRETLKLIGYAD